MDTQKELNLSYLLEETVKKAYERGDCLFLARLVLRIIEQNKDIKFNLDLKTLDWIVFDRLAVTLDSLEYEENLQGQFSDISEGVIKLVELMIKRKERGKL
jgi:hypothetical protein